MSERETITIENGEFTCLCGNQSHLDGFYAYQGGREVEPTPEGWASNAYFCAACLRVIDGDSGEVLEQRETIVTLDGDTLTR